MLGCRVNFSGRCVIVPLSEQFSINSVIIPYLTFLELYRFHITNILTREGMSQNQAQERWNNAITKFDRKIYLIMKYLIENLDLKILVNRENCGI
jgi:DNA-directed RNA polymerase beta' subunit